MGLLGFFKGKGNDGEEGPKHASDQQPAPPPPEPEAEPQPEQTANPKAAQFERKAEDIISQLAEINSILEEENTGNAGLSDLVTESPEDAPPPQTPDPVVVPPPQAPPPAQPVQQATGDCIFVAANDVLTATPPEYLCAAPDALAAQYGNSEDFKFQFNRADVMMGLSQGKLEFTLSELINKIALPVFSPDVNQSLGERVQLPLDRIVSLVPPEWFRVQKQDLSKEAVIEEMDDLFSAKQFAAMAADAKEGDDKTIESAPAAQAPPPASSEPLPEEPPVPEPLTTEQPAPEPVAEEPEPEPPEPSPADEEAVQRNPYKSRALVQVQGDNVLLDPIVVLERIPEDRLLLTKGEILDQVGGELTFSITKEETLASFKQGKMVFPLKELFLKFSFELFNEAGATDEAPIELPLQEIVPLLPVDWYAVQGQDESPSEVLNQMGDIFDGGQPAEEPLAPEPEEEPEVEAPAGVSDSQMFSVQPEPEPVVGEEPPQPEPAPTPEEPEQVAASSELRPPTPVQEGPESDNVPDSQILQPQPEIEPEPQPEQEVKPEPSAGIPIEEADRVPGDEKQAEDIHTADTFTLPRGTEGLTGPKVTVPPPANQQAAEIDTDTKTFQVKTPEEVADAETQVRAAQHQPLQATADEVKAYGAEIFVRKDALIGQQAVDIEPPAHQPKTPVEWKSQAPNGININRSGVEQLCLLSNVGPHLARQIVEHRQKNGPFKDLKDLLKITGLGSKTYREMTGMSARSDLRTAELRLNRTIGVDKDTISLGQVASAAAKKFGLSACFVGSSDGLILAQSADSSKIATFSEPLAAVAPQLHKRARKALSQASLPTCDMFTFFLGEHAVTFAGADQVFCAMIHKGGFPQQRLLRNSRKFADELVWYCSCRAVI